MSVTALATLLWGTAQVISASTPPNIIYILADDHGVGDLGLWTEDESVETPHLDYLAQAGVNFQNGYATAGICSPSRIAITTGRYQQRLGTYWYRGEALNLDQLPTIPERLQARGYTTAMVGKFHFNGTHPGPSERNFPTRHGYDFFYGFSGGAKHYLIHNQAAEDAFLNKVREHAPGNLGYPIMFPGPMWIQEEKKDQEGFATELFGQKARDFIASHQGQPFFLMLSFSAVHDVTQQLPAAYLAEQGLPPYREWDPAVETAAEWLDGALETGDGRARAYLLAQLHYLDTEVGKLLEFMQKKGLRENTLLIYHSDNGGSLKNGASNGSLRGGKFSLFEGGVRVPMFLSWPARIPSAQTFAAPVSSLDLAATLLAAAGEEPLTHLDGHNLLPYLVEGVESPASLMERPLFWAAEGEFAVRAGRWKLHHAAANRRRDRQILLPHAISLFDLETDPGEKVNRITEHPAEAAHLLQLFLNWRTTMATPQ